MDRKAERDNHREMLMCSACGALLMEDDDRCHYCNTSVLRKPPKGCGIVNLDDFDVKFGDRIKRVF